MRLFWLTFLSLAFLAGNLSAQSIADTVLFRCLEHNMPHALNNTNLLTLCSYLPDNLTNCFENYIYDSEALFDQMYVKNINIKNMNKAFKYFCSTYDIMNKENLSCLSEIQNFLIPYYQKLTMNCFNDIILGVYQIISTCSPKGAIIFSKVLAMVKSTACTLSSYRYKLKPFYGPEIHCYPKIQKSSGTAAAKLGQNYEYFCTKFKKENVSQCIETNLLTKKSSFLLDDDYVKKAKEFFRERSQLCEYFSRSTPKTCPSVDVVSCQEDLFKKDAIPKPFDVLLRSYADCVYDTYKTCDITVAKIIRYNLDGIKSMAMNLSVPFVLIVSQAAIILSLFF